MHARFNTLLALTASLASTSAIGQVTILPTDVYQVGDRYRLAVDDNPTVGFGDPGADRTWIFTGLNNTWDYTIETMLAVDAPLGAVAPGAIAAVTSLDNAAYHYDVDASALRYTGDSWEEDGTPFGMAYQPPRVQLQFPAQIGQQYASTSRSVIEWYLGENVGWGFVADSVRRRTHFSYSYEIDGWGQLFTPYGFAACIRVNTLMTTIDSIDAKPAGSATWVQDVDIMDMATREVAYWSPSHSMPVLRLLDLGDWGFVTNAVWIAAQEISTGVQQPSQANTFRVYPNPTTDRIDVTTDHDGEKGYRLLSAEGKLLQAGRYTGTQTSLSLKGFDPGVYILEVRDGKRVQQQRLIKQ